MYAQTVSIRVGKPIAPPKTGDVALGRVTPTQTCFPSPRSRPPSARASRSTRDASRTRTSRPRAEVRRIIFRSIDAFDGLKGLDFNAACVDADVVARVRVPAGCARVEGGARCGWNADAMDDARDDVGPSGGARTMEDDYRRCVVARGSGRGRRARERWMVVPRRVVTDPRDVVKPVT